MPAVPKKLYGCAGITGFIGTKTEVQSLAGYEIYMVLSNGLKVPTLFELQLTQIVSGPQPLI